MLKRLKLKLRNEKGITLVEMITALAIFSILMTSVAMLFQPSIRVYMESTNLSRSNLLLDNAMDRIADEMTYADQITPGELWPEDSSSFITGMKTLEYESPSYGTMRLEQNDTEGVQIKQIFSDEMGTVKPGTVLYSQDFYMGNKLMVGIEPQYAGSETESSVVCINIAVIDSKGQLMGTSKRYVTLLNTVIPK